MARQRCVETLAEISRVIATSIFTMFVYLFVNRLLPLERRLLMLNFVATLTNVQ